MFNPPTSSNKKTMHIILYISIILVTNLLTLSPSTYAQSISSFTTSNSPWHPSQNRTLVSPNSIFAAGFQPSPTSKNLFIFSIWYSNISKDHTIVWSANWGSPVLSSASLIITSNGQLHLINSSSGPTIWTPQGSFNPNSTSLNLTDDGNLKFGSWESFSNPTDTLLPGQIMNSTNFLTSRNGKFSFVGSERLVFNGSDTYWVSGSPFLSLGFGQALQAGASPFTLADFDQDRIRRLTLGDDGNFRALSFDPVKQIWVPVWEALLEICQVHGLCGPNTICFSDGLTLSGYECWCPPGYRRSPGSDSCERKTPIIDTEKSKFLRLDYVNFADVASQVSLKAYEFDVCESKCRTNKRCLGFGFKYDGSGYCVLQLDRLINGYWSPTTELVFYLKVDNSESDSSNFSGMSEMFDTMCPVQLSLPDPPNDSNGTTRNVIIVAILYIVEISIGVLLFWAFMTRYVKYRDMAQTLGLGLQLIAGPKRFTYAEISLATKNFAEENVIGKGGFSDVYVGKLQDGRPVAVKCLKNVTGGDMQFWAEVTIIARMHHLNLVRLWGFCNEKGRRILIYEHIPNGSLNKYLFTSASPGSDNLQDYKPKLDWNIRYRIALGVARAIAYLHEECLEWVLHCDIKPENILLGDDFCPKVADFGLSKLRKKEQIVTKSRIRGTRGYLAPEWVKNDSITSKVDVYSFGMVLLEIVTGVRNMVQGPYSIPSEDWYLPQWAFEMAIEERRMDKILDHQIKHSYDDKMHFKLIDRMVKTAMWCVQEKPEDRPSMGKVTKMLEGTVEIMEPPKPTIFFTTRGNE